MKGRGAEGGLVKEGLANLMELARGLALRAGEITLKYFGEVLVADARPRPVTLPDGSTVTGHDAVVRARRRA